MERVILEFQRFIDKIEDTAKRHVAFSKNLLEEVLTGKVENAQKYVEDMELEKFINMFETIKEFKYNLDRHTSFIQMNNNKTLEITNDENRVNFLLENEDDKNIVNFEKIVRDKSSNLYYILRKDIKDITSDSKLEKLYKKHKKHYPFVTKYSFGKQDGIVVIFRDLPKVSSDNLENVEHIELNESMLPKRSLEQLKRIRKITKNIDIGDRIPDENYPNQIDHTTNAIDKDIQTYSDYLKEPFSVNQNVKNFNKKK